MGKSKQKISNWKLYNLALVKRGSLTLWMDEQAIKHWHCQTHHGRRGRGFHYSDRAIDTARTTVVGGEDFTTATELLRLR